MALPRREFLAAFGAGKGAPAASPHVIARGREALEGEFGYGASAAGVPPPAPGEIRVSSNENPVGPSPQAVAALLGEFPQVMRYPFNSRKADRNLKDAVAAAFKVKAENVVLGAGSGEILRNAARAFTTRSRHLVTAAPTFATCEETCKQIGHPVKSIPVDRGLRLDLGAMVDAATGGGLVFLCNPNNPTATVYGAKDVADFVAAVKRRSPDTAILIDEAYHDYVADPSYKTSLELALEHPGVFITRTFSKAHGMAGLRIGYAIGQAETIKALARYTLTYGANVLAIAAAMASLADSAYITQEAARNAAARKFTLDFFARAGYKATDSQTNFVFVDLGRPAKAFREACAASKVFVGRDFPPLEKTHSRISIGTLEEMQQATEVFARVLGAPTSSAARP